jgi:hypothetical protein
MSGLCLLDRRRRYGGETEGKESIVSRVGIIIQVNLISFLGAILLQLNYNNYSSTCRSVAFIFLIFI